MRRYPPSRRVPAYIRIDVRVDHTFTVRDKPLLVFLGAQDVIYRTNGPIIGLNWTF